MRTRNLPFRKFIHPCRQELERSSGEDLESDLAHARSRLGLMRRLEEEAILATPDCLLHCYQLALAVEEVVGGNCPGVVAESEVYKREARELCRKFGGTFCYNYTDITGETLEPK